MSFSRYSNKETCLSVSVLLAIMLTVVFGCEREDGLVVVDFSKTAPWTDSSGRPAKDKSLRVAVGSMVSPKESFASYHHLLDFMGRKLGRDIQLIQRKTYGEINALFHKGEVDLAFICSGPYVTGKDRYGFEVLAVPQIRGSVFYEAYLIVNRDSTIRTLEDLRGRIFAFTDPESNTGRLVPLYWLSQLGEQPETFFSNFLYTYSHDNSIMAVAKSLVDGASVDGLTWEYYHRKAPDFTARTRIIKKSQPFGIPPLVFSKTLSKELREKIRETVFSLHTDDKGRKILDALMIDRFVGAEDGAYAGISQMIHELEIFKGKAGAISGY